MRQPPLFPGDTPDEPDEPAPIVHPSRVVDSLETLIHEGARFHTIYVNPPVGHPYDLAALPIAQLAERQCYVHVWADVEGAFDLLRAWGIPYKGTFVMAYEDEPSGYWRDAFDILFLGVWGSPQRGRRDIASVAYGRLQPDGRRPALVRDKVRDLSQGPRLEIYGDGEAAEWTVYIPPAARLGPEV